MSRVVGIAPLDGWSRGSIVAHDAVPITVGDNQLGGIASIVWRGESAAMAFALDVESSTAALQGEARRGKLAARATIERHEGLPTVTGLQLYRDEGTAWADDVRRESLPDDLKPWSQAVRLLALGVQRRASDRAGRRPAGRGVVDLAIDGEITETTAGRIKSVARLSADDTIRLRINSRGGSCRAAVEIYDALSRHPRAVVVDVAGEASSAAAVVAMAGDRRAARRGSVMLLHKPTPAGPAAATVAGRRHAATMAVTFAGILADRTGRSRETTARWMTDASVFGASQALDVGLIDEVTA